MTFADPRELRKRKIAALREALTRAQTDDERATIQAELHELTKFRLRHWLWPGGPHDR
jgi:hypothetical protein